LKGDKVATEFQSKTIHVNGVDLAYFEHGAGDTVIFVHGGSTDFRSWMFQIESFAQRYRVISYSRRYHFPNSRTDKVSEYLAAEHRDDLAALIKGLGLASTHVVASSYGAYISLLLAHMEPGLVRSLVLGEPAALPFLGNEFVKSHIERTIEPSRQTFKSGDPEQAIRIFIDAVTGNGTFDQLPPSARQMMLDNAPEFELEVNTSPDRYFTTFDCDDAKLINVPTLLVTGELSPQFLHRIVDELQQCLPNTERAVIPRASHGMHSMNPQAYNQTILAFLAKH
jgi:pimeloyl-ACP methyl ester carboxylesterase